MTSKKKKNKLIKSAKTYDGKSLFNSIYIINSEKNYDGFWGQNGFRKIIVIGVTAENELFKIENNQYDLLEINNPYDYSLRFEISNKNDCLHMFVNDPYRIKVKLDDISNLILEVVKINEGEAIRYYEIHKNRKWSI